MKNWRTSLMAFLAALAEGLQRCSDPRYQTWGLILWKISVPLGLYLAADSSHPALQPASTTASEDPRQSKLPGVGMLLLCGGLLFGEMGCAHLNPGADPVIVRAEQTEQIADSTFGLFLHLEHENSALVKTNAPAAHQFAEWLRAPQIYQGKPHPRASVLIFSLQDVKAAYRAGRADSNLVLTATATLSAAVNQAAQWSAQISPSKH